MHNASKQLLLGQNTSTASLILRIVPEPGWRQALMNDRMLVSCSVNME